MPYKRDYNPGWSVANRPKLDLSFTDAFASQMLGMMRQKSAEAQRVRERQENLTLRKEERGEDLATRQAEAGQSQEWRQENMQLQSEFAQKRQEAVAKQNRQLEERNKMNEINARLDSMDSMEGLSEREMTLKGEIREGLKTGTLPVGQGHVAAEMLYNQMAARTKQQAAQAEENADLPSEEELATWDKAIDEDASLSSLQKLAAKTMLRQGNTPSISSLEPDAEPRLSAADKKIQREEQDSAAYMDSAIGASFSIAETENPVISGAGNWFKTDLSWNDATDEQQDAWIVGKLLKELAVDDKGNEYGPIETEMLRQEIIGNLQRMKSTATAAQPAQAQQPQAQPGRQDAPGVGPMGISMQDPLAPGGQDPLEKLKMQAQNGDATAQAVLQANGIPWQ